VEGAVEGEEVDGKLATGNRAAPNHEHTNVRGKQWNARLGLHERAYSQNTHANIRRIIQNLEEEATQEQSELEMEDWEYLLPDPGNTRGHMSLYKQALHVYWVMK